MKRARILITGKKIHNIGYRLFLFEMADAAGVDKFYAKNIRAGVEVLAGGENGVIDLFIQDVKRDIHPLAEVQRIEVEDYDGEIRPIERFAQGFMLTQMGKFVGTAVEISDKIDTVADKIDESRIEIAGKIDESRIEIAGKIDESRIEISDKIDTVADKIDESKVEIAGRIDCAKDAIIESRTELSQKLDTVADKVESKDETIDTRLTHIEEDVAVIKSRLGMA